VFYAIRMVEYGILIGCKLCRHRVSWTNIYSSTIIPDNHLGSWIEYAINCVAREYGAVWDRGSYIINHLLVYREKRDR